MDSVDPPTSQEIDGHIRYLSEVAIRIVAKDVDDCVRYCLRYSSTPAGKNATKGAVESVSACATKMMKRNDDGGEDTDDDTILASLKTKEGMEAKETDASATHLKDILSDMLPTKYDPTLLPMTTIKCYPNVLDRAEMTKGLLLDLSKKNRRNPNPRPHQHNSDHQQESSGDERNPCICVIRSTSELVQQGNIMTEVLSQCISNDPNGEAFAMKLQWQRKRQKSGGVSTGSNSSLVDWAGFTEAFDSIIVILEDPEKIPSPTLGPFFTSLASLRSNDGVPINAILIDANPGGLMDRLSRLRDPALCSTAGVMTHELSVPMPEVQLDIFVNRLYAGKCIPTFLWTNHHLLKDIQKIFHDIDNSIVSVAKQLKATLRHHFSIPAAITSMLHCEEFTIPNEARIRWLFGNEHCRKIMLPHSGSAAPEMKEDQKDGHIFDLFWKMQTSYLCHQVLQRISTIFNSPLEKIGQVTGFISMSSGFTENQYFFKSPLEKIGQVTGPELYSSLRMHELLLLISTVRDKAVEWNDANPAPSNRSLSLCNKLSEFMILAGNSTDVPMRSKALVENIVAWAGGQFSFQVTLEENSPVQPRRDVAKALSLPAPNVLRCNPLSHASRIAFQVFQTKVMALVDWHEKYFDIVANQDGQDVGAPTNEASFFFAVYELVHCGFVRKLTTGRRKEESYEKVAIIWGNGQ
eukprot:CAMPEP_0181095050 /NCGR_PEP_ID=MMETSP1071-20121207/10318_1 /TAXON_ID=35127 /ORGANISM="Thalassiosira sp., Strain NH16" /LENGTH=690 /DNA_ID=CAMNT_0023177417 /DNA_START=185 /DNA_END=2260 /DNA_ORIENTATION=+